MFTFERTNSSSGRDCIGRVACWVLVNMSVWCKWLLFYQACFYSVCIDTSACALHSVLAVCQHLPHRTRSPARTLCRRPSHAIPQPHTRSSRYAAIKRGPVAKVTTCCAALPACYVAAAFLPQLDIMDYRATA